ncbi:ATP-binding protein [Streptomyces caeni]|uniref:ATP-binding protein n=1 Tax=Streptomyces caeni TaxID=2307231 RepID=A0ABW4J3P1_9ACTN
MARWSEPTADWVSPSDEEAPQVLTAVAARHGHGVGQAGGPGHLPGLAHQAGYVTGAGDEVMDDPTVVRLPASLTGSPRSRTYSCPVAHVPEAVGTVRRRAHTVLTAWGIPQSAVEGAVLVISELVTNAIIHALPPAELRLSVGGVNGCGTLRVEVTDAGAALSSGETGSLPGHGEHGRGNTVVDALTVRHGTRSGAGTVTRWADLPTA